MDDLSIGKGRSKLVNKKQVILFVSIILATTLVFIFVLTAFEKNGKTESYYCVYSKSYSSIFDARAESSKAKLKGGGGNVYSKNGRYYVLLSAYNNKADAEFVMNNLKGKGGGVVEVSVNSEKEGNAEILQVWEKLNEISNAYERAEISINEAKLMIYDISMNELSEKNLNYQNKYTKERALQVKNELSSLALSDKTVFSYQTKELANKLILQCEV